MAMPASWSREPVSGKLVPRYEIVVPTGDGHHSFGFTVPLDADGNPDFARVESRFQSALEALEEAKADWQVRQAGAK